MTQPLSTLHAPADQPPELTWNDKVLKRLAELSGSRPAVSAAEVEQFWTEGSQAYPPQPVTSENQSNDDATSAASAWASSFCVGVDMPGVGHVKSCCESGIARGSAYVAGVVPQPLRDMVDGVEFSGNYCSLCGARRLDSGLCSQPHAPNGHCGCWDPTHDLRQEKTGMIGRPQLRLLIDLMFAARDLAQRNLRPTHILAVDHGEEIRTAGCSECFMSPLAGVQPHTGNCRTGRVLGIIAELMSTNTFEPKGKEAAPDGETGRVGDGIRPRGLKDRVCLKCGVRGGIWTAEQRPDPEVELSLLGLNQCVGTGIAGKGHTLYTHHCQSRSAARHLTEAEAQAQCLEDLRRAAAHFGGAI